MLNSVIEPAAAIAIGGHVRPDGDCVGSCMGLYQYILDVYKDKEVDVYLEDIPDVHKFIKATRDIRHEIRPDKQYDLFITLDCGDKERLGFSLPLFEHAKDTFCIDHHISNQEFARVNYVLPDASSTSELVYQLINKDRLTPLVAEALYLGIVHDTGVFQYSCASPETFEAAAVLLRTGIDGPGIIENTFYEKTYAQNQVMGYALLESKLLLGGRCIVSHLTMEQMDRCGVYPKDLDGIVSQLRMTKGVEVAVFLYELEQDLYKVSLRAKDRVDVSRIAQYYGGGGHRKAAGFSMTGTPGDILDHLAGRIELQL